MVWLASARAHAADDPAIRQALDRAANQHPTAGSAVRTRTLERHHGQPARCLAAREDRRRHARRHRAAERGAAPSRRADHLGRGQPGQLSGRLPLLLPAPAHRGAAPGGALRRRVRPAVVRARRGLAVAADHRCFVGIDQRGHRGPDLVSDAGPRSAAEPVLDHLDPCRRRRADLRPRGATRRTALDAADPRGGGAHAGCLERWDVVAGSDLLGRSRAQRHAHARAHGDAARRSQSPDPAPERADDDHVARRARPDAGDRPLRAPARARPTKRCF